MVAELSEKYPLNIEIIKKSDMPFIDRRLVNEFPAVAISDNIVFKGRDVSIDDGFVDLMTDSDKVVGMF